MRTLLRTPKGTHEGYAEGTQKSLRTGTQMGYANAKKVRTLSGLLVHINRSEQNCFEFGQKSAHVPPVEQARSFPQLKVFSRKQGQRGATLGQ